MVGVVGDEGTVLGKDKKGTVGRERRAKGSSIQRTYTSKVQRRSAPIPMLQSLFTLY